MKHIRKLTSWLLTIALIFALLPVVAIRARADDPTWGGTGTSGDPYRIGKKADLEKFRNIVNGENGETQNTAACAKLTADIALEGNDTNKWEPIGKVAPPVTGYTGTFDGQGHRITGLYVNGGDYCGLFGKIGTVGMVKNVSVSGTVIGSGYYVGGVVGKNTGTVTNCSYTGAVAGTYGVGGVMGENTGTVTNCNNTGSVTGGGDDVGGFVGYNTGTVTNCYNTGKVTGKNSVGGIVGANGENPTVTNCYNTGEVLGDSGVGGVVGANGGNSTVTNCYNTGEVHGSSPVGGIVGANLDNSTVTNCYNTGEVLGDSGVGGVVGANGDGATVTNCYYLTRNAEYGIGVGNGIGNGIAKPVSNLKIVLTWSDLYNALRKNNSVVVLGADVTYGTGGDSNANKDLVVPENTTVDLDLTGHVIDRAASEGWGSVITVNGNLTITDSSEGKTGKITGGNTSIGGGVNVNSGIFTLKGGTISGNTASSNGGGVCISERGSFTLEDGTISGNTASNGGGVCIFSGGSSFTLKDGTISGNTAGDGGGVYIEGGSFTLEDGTISGNTASSNGGGVYIDASGSFTLEGGTISGNTASDGGGVYINNIYGIFTLEGGTISGNTASTNGGGVFCNGTFNLSGGATISGNYKGTDDTATDYNNNVYLKTNKIITITGALTDTTLIGVTTTNSSPYTFTSGLGGTTPRGTAANFTSDNAAYVVALNASKEAYLGTREGKPTAIFTATGADSGELSGLTADKSYSISGAGLTTATVITADTNGKYTIASGMTAGTLSIVKKGNGSTTVDSLGQTITVTKAETPNLAVTQPTTGGTGSVATDSTHEYSTDGTSWTSCTGALTGLTQGTYYVRVKANGTTLASDNQTVTIQKKPSPPSPGPGPSYSYYTVKFEMNGHGEQVSSQTIRSGLKAKRPQDPTAEEYYFAGWFEDAGLTKEYDFSSAVKKNMTLYARWEEIRYTVSFGLDGKGSIETQWVRKNGMAEKPDDPSAEGYTFDGWYIDPDCTKLYDFSTPVTKDITVYAKWVKDVLIYRLYNPNSGAHLFTSNAAEKDNLVLIGWEYEGIAWTAPASSNIPVYRLYNPNSGEHHYTKDAAEKDILVTLGWNYEGISWYSDENQGTPLYRLYNPNATGQYAEGAHHYTKDVEERDYLIAAGWNDEGIGWYGI